MKAFRASLLKRGFERTTMQQMLTELGLSKGAMYHHFKSKADVMEAVYEEESRGAIERAVAAVNEIESPIERLHGMCVAWMAEVSDKSVSKILFTIGPSALGVEKAREIEGRLGLRYIEDVVQQAVEAGEAQPHDIALSASFINALVGEAALHYLRTGRDGTAAIGRMLGAVLPRSA